MCGRKLNDITKQSCKIPFGEMDGETNLCVICKIAITQNDESIKCDGACLRKFHVRCLKFTPSFLKQFKECKNLLYNCDVCVCSPITSLSETVKKMLSYLQIIDERIKRHDNEFQCVFENIELVHDNMRENKGHLMDEIEKLKVNRNSDHKQSNLEKKSIPLEQQPKKSQKSATTKSELTKSIDPKSIGISDIHNIPNGGIVIDCKTRDETTKLKEEAHMKMGDKYTVKITESNTVKVKLIGMSDKLSEDEMLKTMKEQNDFLKNSEIKIKTIFENKKRNDFGAILEIDNEAYNKILNGDKIKIGWCRCRVFECVDVRRCYKCCGYNHISSHCKNRLSCLKCGGEHLMKDCSARNSVCVNCKIAVEKLNVKLDIFHPAYSFTCPVYKRKIQIEKKKMKFNI